MCLIVFAWRPGHALPPAGSRQPRRVLRPAGCCTGALGRRARSGGRPRPAGRRHLAGPRRQRALRRPYQYPRSASAAGQCIARRAAGTLSHRIAKPCRVHCRAAAAAAPVQRFQPLARRRPTTVAPQSARSPAAAARRRHLRPVQRHPRHALAKAAACSPGPAAGPARRR